MLSVWFESIYFVLTNINFSMGRFRGAGLQHSPKRDTRMVT